MLISSLCIVLVHLRAMRKCTERGNFRHHVGWNASHAMQESVRRACIDVARWNAMPISCCIGHGTCHHDGTRREMTMLHDAKRTCVRRRKRTLRGCQACSHEHVFARGPCVRSTPSTRTSSSATCAFRGPSHARAKRRGTRTPCASNHLPPAIACVVVRRRRLSKHRCVAPLRLRR